MPFTTVLMGSSADRSGADVALPIALGENSVTGNGVPGTGTSWYPKWNGYITNAIVNSETAAMIECRFRDENDPNFNKIPNTHLQSAQWSPENINALCYAINTGMAIECSGENGGAVLDIAAFFINQNPTPCVFPYPVGGLPPGTVLARATGAVTAIADGLAEGVISWDNFTATRNVKYKIIGMAAGGKAATPNEGIFTRLKFNEGAYTPYRPGVPCADATKPLMLWGDFGEFLGQTPPNIEHVELNAGAETVELHFALYPVTKVA